MLMRNLHDCNRELALLPQNKNSRWSECATFNNTHHSTLINVEVRPTQVARHVLEQFLLDSRMGKVKHVPSAIPITSREV